LGFAAGVMVAASFWSLLAPGIERAELQMNGGWYACFPVAVAFGMGAVIMLLINFILHRFGFKHDDAVAAALTGHGPPACVGGMRFVESTPLSYWIYF
jgi:zinc transporter ZupT